jgi:hypothetical protein
LVLLLVGDEDVNVDRDEAKEERTGVETLEFSGEGCVTLSDAVVDGLNCGIIRCLGLLIGVTDDNPSPLLKMAFLPYLFKRR